MPPISAVIMVSAGGGDPIERIMLQAQQASVLDLIALLHDHEIDPIVVASPALEWLPADRPVIREPDQPGQRFHFGRRLSGIIQEHRLSTLLYFGGGSTPLLDSDMLTLITGILTGAGAGSIPSHVVLTNNKHSSDWLALTCATSAAALAALADSERDNSLAWLLEQSGEYDVRTITRMRPAAGFDLDTPADLALILHHPGIRPQLATVISQNMALLSRPPIQAVLDTLLRDGSTLALIGRVSPAAWQALNGATSCWVRVFAEERGMIASGRLERGEVRSLLGEMIRREGPRHFFNTLAQMADAAIIDSRPLIASQGCWPDDADRFASDLLLPDQVKDVWLREFTAAALEAPIPILLGGHNVVGGGLHALIEIVRQRQE